MYMCSKTQIMSKSQPAAEKEIVHFRSEYALPPIDAKRCLVQTVYSPLPWQSRCQDPDPVIPWRGSPLLPMNNPLNKAVG